MKKHNLFLVAALVLLLSASCKATSESSDGSDDNATACIALEGTWDKSNQYSIVYTSTTFSFKDSGVERVNGSYQLADGEIQYTDLGGDWACSSAIVGTYNCQDNSDGSITIALKTDSCDGRVANMNNTTWTKQ